jgi:hypothetical protein
MQGRMLVICDDMCHAQVLHVRISLQLEILLQCHRELTKHVCLGGGAVARGSEADPCGSIEQPRSPLHALLRVRLLFSCSLAKDSVRSSDILQSQTYMQVPAPFMHT